MKPPVRLWLTTPLSGGHTSVRMPGAAPLRRGEASGFCERGVGFKTPHSPSAHAPLVRGAAKAVAFLASLFMALGSALAQQHDPLRPGIGFEGSAKPPALVNAENNDRKRTRSYAMQPPTIPHKTDNYQVDRFANKCMTCHARTKAGDTQATPISITHYQDRDGNFLADVSPRRYFCEQCHVVQMQAEPTVKNRFQDVDALIKKQSKK
jgi:cytochrome c-type protein NapB